MIEKIEKLKTTIADMDPFTMPNGITVGRLLLSPVVAVRLYRKPQETWRQAGWFCATDKLDGIGAKWLSMIPALRRVGFRRSEFGAKADPVVDQLVVPQMIIAGMANGIIPWHLGAASLAQKGVTSVIALRGFRQGADIEVSPLGQAAELGTDLVFGGLFKAEEIEDPELRTERRRQLTIAGYAGIAAAALATTGYEQQRKQQLAQQPIAV